MKTKYPEDYIYEELEITTLNEVSESLAGDGLETYYEDYVEYEKDLSELIKEQK